MKVLITAKVLKHYGQVKVRTHPMNLYLFVPEALNTYLKDSAKSEMTIIDNASAVETTIEATPKDRDSAKDSAKDSATIAHQEEDSTKEDLQKKKEESTSTGKAIEVSPKEMNEILADGYYEKSGYASIVPGPVGSSTHSRFSVPCGIDDKVSSHDKAKETKNQLAIQNAFKETVLGWYGLHVSSDVIQKRIDAFKVQVDNVQSVPDVFKVFKTITDKEVV